jgi:hypothetical protein
MPEQRQDKKHPDKTLPEMPRRNWVDAVARDAKSNASLAFARAGFRDPTLVLRWEEIAGPDVARIACPIKLSEGPTGGVLTLKAEPGAALFLQHESRALCGRINDYLGRNAVAGLRFVQGPLTTRPPKPAPRAVGGALPPDDPALTFTGPEKVRESLLRFARTRRRAD